MRSILIMAFCLTSITVSAEYPKTITLTVTKITREQKPSAACDNCRSVTTVEAHNSTASFIMVCESLFFPKHPENSSVCAQFETGVHEVRKLDADLVSFWPEKSASERGAIHEYYSILIEEARTSLHACD